jgi:hypothetical protein
MPHAFRNASYDRKRTGRSQSCVLSSIQFHDATAFETAWRAPSPTGGHPLNTTRLNGSCLCAISQLGSYKSCRSWPISRSNGCICSVRIECRSELMTDYAGCRLQASCFAAWRSRLRCSGRFSHSIISSSTRAAVADDDIAIVERVRIVTLHRGGADDVCCRG